MIDEAHSLHLAGDADLSYVLHLQKVWSNQVGFLPKPALQRYIDNRTTLLVRLNNQAAGYLSWQLTKKGLLRLIQLAVDPELLRGKLGTDVMDYIELAAKRGSCSVIRFCARTDLACNPFFQDRQYQTTAIYERPSARRRPLIEWTKCLINPMKLTEALISRSTKHVRRKQFPEPHVKHSRQVASSA